MYAVLYHKHMHDGPQLVRVLWMDRGHAVVIDHKEPDNSRRVSLELLSNLYHVSSDFSEPLKAWASAAVVVAGFEKAQARAREALKTLETDIRKRLGPNLAGETQ